MNTDKKEEILNVAKSFFYSKGYNNTSIQNIIDEANIAKGTFYHYFKSKDDLLDQLTKLDSKHLYKKLYNILDLDLNAIDKLNRIFQEASVWKSENIPMMKVLVPVIMSDSNLQLRFTMSKHSVTLMTPVYKNIIDQGIKEGLFNVRDSEYTAHFLMTSFVKNGEDMQKYLIADKYSKELIDNFKNLILNLEETLERLLGAKHGTIHIIKSMTLEKLLKDLLEA